MTELRSLIEEELKKGGVETTDILKFIFQNEFGPGHTIDDPSAVKMRLETEMENIEGSINEPLYTELGNGYVRLNLKRLKAEDMDGDFISKLAILSSNRPGTREGFENKVKDISDLIPLDEELKSWIADGEKLFSHSESYKSENDPHYIVINKKYVEMWCLLMKLRNLKNKFSVYVGIDGRCGSGKSLIADELSFIFDGQVIRMDDFFLPFELRSDERLKEPGGNVHYERFKKEVKEPLLRGSNSCYGVFSCKTMSINSDNLILNKGYIFVEGSYSLREDLRNLFDLKVFMDVDSDTQLSRIESRNGTEALENFKNKWIPLEERYFNICGIPNIADCNIDTTDTKI